MTMPEKNKPMAGHDVDIGEENLKLYGKLHASADDIAFAKYCVGVILKRKRHGYPTALT